MNKITILNNGPIQLDGDIRIESAEGDTLKSGIKQTFLCRCGHSSNKPFCDGSHKKVDFQHNGEFVDNKPQEVESNGLLLVTVKSNAMLVCSGGMEIVSESGQSRTTREKVALCRCGFSQNKPFCDISHKKHGFTAG